MPRGGRGEKFLERDQKIFLAGDRAVDEIAVSGNGRLGELARVQRLFHVVPGHIVVDLPISLQLFLGGIQRLACLKQKRPTPFGSAASARAIARPVWCSGQKRNSGRRRPRLPCSSRHRSALRAQRRPGYSRDTDRHPGRAKSGHAFSRPRSSPEARARASAVRRWRRSAVCRSGRRNRSARHRACARW